MIEQPDSVGCEVVALRRDDESEHFEHRDLPEKFCRTLFEIICRVNPEFFSRIVWKTLFARMFAFGLVSRIKRIVAGIFCETIPSLTIVSP